jgi:hypothetical protein
LENIRALGVNFHVKMDGRCEKAIYSDGWVGDSFPLACCCADVVTILIRFVWISTVLN